MELERVAEKVVYEGDMDNKLKAPCENCIHADVCYYEETSFAIDCKYFKDCDLKVRDLKRYLYGRGICISTDDGYVFLDEAKDALLDREVDEIRAPDATIHLK